MKFRQVANDRVEERKALGFKIASEKDAQKAGILPEFGMTLMCKEEAPKSKKEVAAEKKLAEANEKAEKATDEARKAESEKKDATGK